MLQVLYGQPLRHPLLLLLAFLRQHIFVFQTYLGLQISDTLRLEHFILRLFLKGSLLIPRPPNLRENLRADSIPRGRQGIPGDLHAFISVKVDFFFNLLLPLLVVLINLRTRDAQLLPDLCGAPVSIHQFVLRQVPQLVFDLNISFSFPLLAEEADQRLLQHHAVRSLPRFQPAPFVQEFELVFPLVLAHVPPANSPLLRSAVFPPFRAPPAPPSRPGGARPDRDG